jgi:hypothetical protein
MGKLKDLHLMNDIEVDEDALGYLMIPDPESYKEES